MVQPDDTADSNPYAQNYVDVPRDLANSELKMNTKPILGSAEVKFDSTNRPMSESVPQTAPIGTGAPVL